MEFIYFLGQTVCHKRCGEKCKNPLWGRIDPITRTAKAQQTASEPSPARSSYRTCRTISVLMTKLRVHRRGLSMFLTSVAFIAWLVNSSIQTTVSSLRHREVSLQRQVGLSQENAPEKLAKIDWTPYRIADGVNRYPGAPGCDEFPGSLVCLYHKATKRNGDVIILLEVIDSLERRKSLPVQPSNNTVIVHLRLGDGLCARIDQECRANVTSVPDCWENDADCWQDPVSKKRYAFSKKWYHSVILQLPPSQNIIIVGDMNHWTRGSGDPRSGDFSVDELYRQSVANYFGSFGHQTTIREPAVPDEDFLFMCRARTFIQSGGGLSSLVGSIVEVRGGKVIKPSLPITQ